MAVVVDGHVRVLPKLSSSASSHIRAHADTHTHTDTHSRENESDMCMWGCEDVTVKSLTISFCGITQLDALSSRTFPILTHVNLSHNRLHTLPHMHSVCPGLKSLDVSHNRITSCDFLTNLAYLETLFIQHNAVGQLADLGTCIRTLPCLEALVAYENPCVAPTSLPTRDDVWSHALMRVGKVRASSMAFMSEASASGIADGPIELAALYLVSRGRDRLRKLVLAAPTLPAKAVRRSVPLADGGVGIDVTPLMVAACVLDVTPSFSQAAQAWGITPFASVYAEKVGEAAAAASLQSALGAGALSRSTSQRTPSVAVGHSGARVTHKPAARALAKARSAASTLDSATEKPGYPQGTRTAGPDAATHDADDETAADTTPNNSNADADVERITQRMALRRGPRLSTSVAVAPFPEQLSITPLSERARAGSSAFPFTSDDVPAATNAPTTDRSFSTTEQPAEAESAAVQAYCMAPGELDPAVAAECTDGYHVTFSGRVLASSDGSGTEDLDADDGKVALRVRPDGTAACKWPSGQMAMDVTVDERAVAAMVRYKEAMNAWKTSGLVSSYSVRRASLVAARAAVDENGLGTAPQTVSAEERAYRVIGRSLDVAENPHVTWMSIMIDGFGVGAVTSNDGGVLLAFHDDASGFHADDRGILMRRWNALGELTYVCPHFVEDDPSSLMAEPCSERLPPPANSRPNTAPRDSRRTTPEAASRPSKSVPSAAAAAAAVASVNEARRRPRPPPADDVVALRQALLTDMFPTLDDDRLADLAIHTESKTYFCTATACGFVLGRHMAVMYDLVVHQLKLYLACRAFRYELVVASATGSSLQDDTGETTAPSPQRLDTTEPHDPAALRAGADAAVVQVPLTPDQTAESEPSPTAVHDATVTDGNIAKDHPSEAEGPPAGEIVA